MEHIETTPVTESVCEYCNDHFPDSELNHLETIYGTESVCESCINYFDEYFFYCQVCNIYHPYDDGYHYLYRIIYGEIFCLKCSIEIMLNPEHNCQFNASDYLENTGDAPYFLSHQISETELIEHGFKLYKKIEFKNSTDVKNQIKEMIDKGLNFHIILRDSSHNPFWSQESCEIWYKEI